MKKDPDPDPYLWLMNPDPYPGGQQHNVYASGSGTLSTTIPTQGGDGDVFSSCPVVGLEGVGGGGEACTLITTVLWLLRDFLSFKNDVNVVSKSNKQKNLKVTNENSRIQVPDLLNRGTDPHQNVTDPQHWFRNFHLYELFTDEAALSLSLKLSLWLPKVEMEICSASARFSAWRVWVEEARQALILGYCHISCSTPSHSARTESQNHGPNIYKDTKP